jgi:hypothetical protein
VNHVLRRKKIAVGNPSVTRGATAQRATLAQQLRARGAVDRTVHTAAAEQRGVGGVDDRVYRKPRDVGLDGPQPLCGP